jgi:hypothetical protein
VLCHCSPPKLHKVKIKLSLHFFLTKHHDMEYWGSGSIAPSILDLGFGGEWSASRPGRFTPREIAPDTIG